MSALSIMAPAKINLTLEVLGKRPDGYHEVRSVLQTVDLCDCLKFESARGIDYLCDMPGWSAEKSLVSRAVSLFRESAGCSKGVSIEVKKRIPLISGLGGDSSDAAATLCGLNELWELNLSMERLLALAERLGSDVVFFLHGGAALVEGRGERVTPLPQLNGKWVVIAVPRVPRETGKTGRMYAGLKQSHYTDGTITGRLVKSLKAGRTFESSLLFNTFENIAYNHYSGLTVYREHILKLGAPHVHLAGSGPSLFTIFEDKAQAEELYTRCKQQGMEVYLAETGALP